MLIKNNCKSNCYLGLSNFLLMNIALFFFLKKGYLKQMSLIAVGNSSGEEIKDGML